MSQVQIPKNWKKLGPHCYEDKKGNPHFKTIRKYKTSEKIRTKNKKYGQQNKEQARRNSVKWTKNNLEKIYENREKLAKKYRDCYRKVQLLQIKLRVKKRRKQGYMSQCAEFHHSKCKNLRGNCICKCHNT